MRNLHTVVIGAGAMGSATAWHLARAGCDVVLAEQFEPGHRNGSSHGGVRIFRHAYPDPHYVRMAAAALPLWRELEADTGEVLIELTGAYDHGPVGAIEPLRAALAACHVEHEMRSRIDAEGHVPGLRFDESVLFHPTAGKCFADRTLAALARRTAALGGAVRHGCPARIVAVGTDHVDVDLGGEVVRARTVVVTAGAWVAEQLRAAGIAPPQVVVTQEQVAHFAPRDPHARWPSFIHWVDPSRYGMYTPGEGVKVGGHHEGVVTTADDRSFELGEERLAAIVDYVRTWVPGVVPEPRFGTTCLYTTTPNEDFVLDRVGPIVIGSPCSGHGFKFTPLIGRWLADLARLPDDADASIEAVVPARHRLASFPRA